MTVRIAERSELGISVVEVRGELDLDSTSLLRAALADLLDRGIHRIVLDVGKLRFCDSIGLSVLITTQHACRDSGGFLRLAAPGESLLRLLLIVGLTEHVVAYASVEAAARGDTAQIVQAHIGSMRTRGEGFRPVD
jgi:anti-sigma B factor antagonist